MATANEKMITTIEEAIRIQQEGRTARQNAEIELARMESELRNRLVRASTGQSAQPVSPQSDNIQPLT